MSETIEHRLTKLEAEQETQGRKLVNIEGELRDIVKMLSTRPTWIIASFLTILTSITTGLIVFVSTH